MLEQAFDLAKSEEEEYGSAVRLVDYQLKSSGLSLIFQHLSTCMHPAQDFLTPYLLLNDILWNSGMMSVATHHQIGF